MITPQEYIDIDFYNDPNDYFMGPGYRSRKTFTKYNYVSVDNSPRFNLLHSEPKVELPVFYIVGRTNEVRHMPSGERMMFVSLDELKGFIKEMDSDYDFGVYKEMDRLDAEYNLKRDIVKNGFRYTVDPFLKDVFISQETFMKPAGYESMTDKPYEMFKYFIRFDEGKIKIYHMPSGDREIVTTFEDIKHFMCQMKKLEDAL